MDKESIQNQENLEDSNTEQTTDLSESAINDPDEWKKHLEEADKATEEAKGQTRISEPNASVGSRPKINLEKTKIYYRDKSGNLIETQDTKERFTSLYHRYPRQEAEINKAMQESLENEKPLRITNIGVARGQEAMAYIQMASDMVGEDSIDDVLDLELVEYAEKIEPDKSYRMANIEDSSNNYLKDLMKSPKAHFGTPFQEFVRDLKAKGEKRDVVLFNNVLQHLDYDVPKEQMLQDMENMADIVADGGMLCMTCNQYGRKEKIYQEVTELYDKTVDMLKDKGFEGEDTNTGAKTSIGRQIIFKKVKPSSEGE